MWELHQPRQVKLITGILAGNEEALAAAVKVIGTDVPSTKGVL